MNAEERAATTERETSVRRERFLAALESVTEKYPDLEKGIRRSLETPQLGAHHNEGPTMEAHIERIVEALYAIRDGQFPKEIDSETRDIIYGLVSEGVEGKEVNPTLIDYAFLHDISKPDCLILKIEGKSVEVTWGQWQKIAEEGRPYRFRGGEISSIGYYHSSEGELGTHGKKGANFLKDRGVPRESLAAIGMHEIAYQFQSRAAKNFRKHFADAGFTDREAAFILTASYIDTVASLGPDGKPDLRNFLNLIAARKNYLLVKEYLDRGVIFKEDSLGEFLKANRDLARAEIEAIAVQG